MEKQKNEIVAKLNESIALGMSANELQGFDKAFVIADATNKLQSLLTSDYMKPIMALQGNKLGFKTDKDNEKGYSENIVKTCIIEAVLTGVQPVGNQFNIIAGNCYITKEGFGYLLKNYPGLTYEIIPKLPRINNDSTSAAIMMIISWSLGNQDRQTREIEFPIKMNKFMGVDAIIGKATRKARAWLYNSLSGLEIADGDIQDVSYIDVSKPKKELEILSPEHKDWNKYIEAIKTKVVNIDDLKAKFDISEENFNTLKNAIGNTNV